jgi:multicomponent Na+:H+ antiporter subunit F
MVLVTLVLVLVRPGVLDRIIAVGVIGTKTTLLLVLTGEQFGRLDMFVDIALTYALLNFIVTLAVAKYFTQRQVVP